MNVDGFNAWMNLHPPTHTFTKTPILHKSQNHTQAHRTHSPTTRASAQLLHYRKECDGERGVSKHPAPIRHSQTQDTKVIANLIS